LRVDRRRHREEVFRQLVEYWAELGRRGFWETLKGVVEARGGPPAAAPSPLPTAAAVSQPGPPARGNGNGNPRPSPDKALLTTGS
jgi:hypothetical protein